MAESTTTRLIKAPRPSIYHALIDGQALAEWLHPAGSTSKLLECVPTVMFRGALVSDEPALAGQMQITFTLNEEAGGTRITLRHEGLPEGISVQDNERGFESSLANLARLVEGQTAA